MIFIPHVLVGAAIGVKVQHIGWIIVLGIISHIILDKIPHWDYGNKAIERFFQNKSYKILFIFFLQMIIDGLIGLAMVFFIIWQKNIITIEYLIFIIIGIFASVLPDLTLGIVKLLSKKFKKLSKFYIKLHNKYLHCPKHIFKPTFLGVSTQVIVSIIAILILLL